MDDISIQAQEAIMKEFPLQRPLVKGIAADGGLYVPERIPGYRYPALLPCKNGLQAACLLYYEQISDRFYRRRAGFLASKNAYDEKFDTPELRRL